MSGSEATSTDGGVGFEPVAEFVRAIQSGEPMASYVDALQREWTRGDADARSNLLQNYHHYLSTEVPEIADKIVGVMCSTIWQLDDGGEFSGNEDPLYVTRVKLRNLLIVAHEYGAWRGFNGPSGYEFLRVMFDGAGRVDPKLRAVAIEILVERATHELDAHDVLREIRWVRGRDGIERAIALAERYAVEFHEAVEDPKETLIRIELEDLRRALAAPRQGDAGLGVPGSAPPLVDKTHFADDLVVAAHVGNMPAPMPEHPVMPASSESTPAPPGSPATADPQSLNPGSDGGRRRRRARPPAEPPIPPGWYKEGDGIAIRGERVILIHGGKKETSGLVSAIVLTWLRSMKEQHPQFLTRTNTKVSNPTDASVEFTGICNPWVAKIEEILEYLPRRGNRMRIPWL